MLLEMVVCFVQLRETGYVVGNAQQLADLSVNEAPAIPLNPRRDVT